jgi:hypothetical protein
MAVSFVGCEIKSYSDSYKKSAASVKTDLSRLPIIIMILCHIYALDDKTASHINKRYMTID